MTDITEMEARIKKEAEEINNSPRFPVQTGSVGRCSMCGRVAKNLVIIDSFHGTQRYRGECCQPRYSGE